jgi:hypothetical protein
VQIVIVMFSPRGNYAAMKKIAAATVNSAYEISNAARIGKSSSQPSRGGSASQTAAP